MTYEKFENTKRQSEAVNRKMVNTMTKRKRTNNNLHSNTQRTNHWETYVCVNIQNIMINCNTIYTNWIPIILFISKSITLVMQSFLSEFISSNIEKIKHKTNNPNLATTSPYGCSENNWSQVYSCITVNMFNSAIWCRRSYGHRHYRSPILLVS